LAAAVYAKNCDEFCKNKSNTYSVEENGKKTSKRRCREERDGNENKSTLNNEENTSFNLNFEIFKERIRNKCIQSVKEFENLQLLKSKDLNQILSTSSPSIELAKQAFGVTEITQLPVQKKQAINCMAFLLDLHRFIGKSNTGIKPNFHFYKKFN
jgi:hypothetical protein